MVFIYNKLTVMVVLFEMLFTMIKQNTVFINY
jgi:hypothetical protein